LGAKSSGKRERFFATIGKRKIAKSPTLLAESALGRSHVEGCVIFGQSKQGEPMASPHRFPPPSSSPEFWEKCGGLENGIARLFFCYAGQPRGGVPKKDLAQSFLRPRSYPRTHQGGSLNRMSQARVRGGPTMAQTSPKVKSKQENANERTKVLSPAKVVECMRLFSVGVLTEIL
jgi:hypothetical protein